MKQEDKQKARELYAQGGLTLFLIAKKLNVSERSVMRWKAEDGARGASWDRARAAAMMGKENVESATQGMLLEFLALHRKVLEEVNANAELSTVVRVNAIASLSDTFVKQVKACALSAPQLSQLAVASEVVKMLAAFVAENHPQAAPALLEAMEPFAAVLEKAFK